MKERCISIIPARGGSKRIPRKNIRDFNGKPIIYYSIDAAIKSGIFSEIMVSTDDTEIKKIAEEYSASVPFLRSGKTSNDFAGLSEVLVEVLNKYRQRNQNFEYLCCILPTAPFINPERIINGFNLLKKYSYDSVLSVVSFSYPVYRALKIEDNKISMIWPENYSKRSQDLPLAYHDAGQFYWISVEKFIKNGIFFTGNSGAVIIPETETQDIDTMEDWRLAEIKYNYSHDKNI